MASSSLQKQCADLSAVNKSLAKENEELTRSISELVQQTEEYKLTISQMQDELSTLQSSTTSSVASSSSFCVVPLPVQKEPRTSSPLQPSPSAGSIFENYFVLGQAEPRVLYQYPTACAFNASVLLTFVRPGLSKFCDTPTSKRARTTFVFTIKAQDRVAKCAFEAANAQKDELYCCCVVSAGNAGPQCTCLVSYFPCFELHFEVLFKILTLTTGRIQPTDEALGLLQEYYENCAFVEGQVSINLQSVPSIELGIADTALIDCEWTCPTLFALLPFDTLYALLAAVMTECSVVFYGQNLEHVSSSVLALTGLMRPFKWQHLICPVLPPELLDMLEAPVPFLVGTQTVPQEILDYSTFIAVDLDQPIKTRRVQRLPKNLPEPCSKRVKEYLRFSYEQAQASDPEDRAFAVHRFVKDLRGWWYDLLDRLPITDGEVDAANLKFIKHACVEAAPPADAGFVRRLVDTQCFTCIVEHIYEN